MLCRLTNGNAVFQPLHYQIYSLADSKVTAGKTFSVRLNVLIFQVELITSCWKKNFLACLLMFAFSAL